MSTQPNEGESWRSSSADLGEPVAVAKVVLMGELRLIAGRQEFAVDIARGSTLQSLLSRLEVICGKAIARRIMTRDGEIYPHVAVFLNGEDIRGLAGTETVLSSGEKVELCMLPVYEGGARFTQW